MERSAREASEAEEKEAELRAEIAELYSEMEGLRVSEKFITPYK